MGSTMSNGSSSNVEVPPVDDQEIKNLLNGDYDENETRLRELYRFVALDKQWRDHFLAESRRRAIEYIKANPHLLEEN